MRKVVSGVVCIGLDGVYKRFFEIYYVSLLNNVHLSLLGFCNE